VVKLARSDYGDSDRAWLDIDWRHHLHRDFVGTTPVVYADYGEGPPLVFIHGLSGCWQNWLDNIPELGKRHRVLALDLPGFGASPPPPWQVTVPNMAQLVRSFCDQLNLAEDTAIVGHSMGGAVAGELIARNSGRFSKLVLVSAAGVSFAKARHEPATLAGRLYHLSTNLMGRYVDAAITRPLLRQAVFSGIIYRPLRIGPEILKETADRGSNAPSFAEAIVSLMGYDGRADLASIDLPTLIVWGHNDRIVPVSASLIYRQRIPNSRLEIFNHTGHMVMMERPRRFNRLLEEFLD
jgi:pimeloyl-ACP methyl ester carboxylesterase